MLSDFNIRVTDRSTGSLADTAERTPHYEAPKRIALEIVNYIFYAGYGVKDLILGFRFSSTGLLRRRDLSRFCDEQFIARETRGRRHDSLDGLSTVPRSAVRFTLRSQNRQDRNPSRLSGMVISYVIRQQQTQSFMYWSGVSICKMFF